MECFCKWASSRLLGLLVYMQIGIGAHRSNRRFLVVTVLTRKMALSLPLIHDRAAFRGKVTPSIVCAWTGERAQLSCTHDDRLQCL